jgi:hypothetical protein
MSLSKSVLYLSRGYVTTCRGQVGRMCVKEKGVVWQTAIDTVKFCRCWSKLSTVTYCMCGYCVCRFAHADENCRSVGASVTFYSYTSAGVEILRFLEVQVQIFSSSARASAKSLQLCTSSCKPPAVLHPQVQTACSFALAGAVCLQFCTSRCKQPQFCTSRCKQPQFCTRRCKQPQFCTRRCKQPAVVHPQVQTACSFALTGAVFLQFCTSGCKQPAVVHMQVQTACSCAHAGANSLQLWTSRCKQPAVVDVQVQTAWQFCTCWCRRSAS